MSSEVPAAGARLQRLSWFDPEAAAMVTILVGLFQVLLAVPLAYSDHTLPKVFILPLVLGILIVAGGSFTVAHERHPSRLLLQGCACSNVAGLLVALLAFCLYCLRLSNECGKPKLLCLLHRNREYGYHMYGCAEEELVAYCWSVTLLLLLCDISAMMLHCLLSCSALKTLKKD
ncbi:uncharacterized protein ACBR49_000247 [Aulostomus maculatus]